VSDKGAQTTESALFAKALVRDIQVRRKGKSPILTLDDPNAKLPEVTEWISTGFEELDIITGGGIPVGRMVEYWGPKAAGKSAATHIAIRSVQEMGGLAVCADYEWSLEPKKVKQLGIDPEALIYLTPKHIEEGQAAIFDVLDQIDKKAPNGPVLFVFDSVGAAIPKKLYDQKEGDKDPIAAHAAAITIMISKLYYRIGRSRASLLFVNQVRANMNAKAFGTQHRTTGGAQYEHGISVSVRFMRISTLKVGEKKIARGYRIKCIVEKNKTAPPHRAAAWDLDFTYGPSPELSMLTTLLAARVVKSAGAKYALPWTKKIYSRDEWVAAMSEVEGFRQRAVEAVREISAEELTGLCAFKAAK